MPKNSLGKNDRFDEGELVHVSKCMAKCFTVFRQNECSLKRVSELVFVGTWLVVKNRRFSLHSSSFSSEYKNTVYTNM